MAKVKNSTFSDKQQEFYSDLEDIDIDITKRKITTSKA